MKLIRLIILISLLYSCKEKNNTQLSDLNFSNLNQALMLKNGIKKTFLISGNDSYLYKKTDTIGYYLYNQNGYIIEEWKKVFGGYNVSFEYDSLNFILKKKHSTDFVAEFDFNYRFNKDSLILYQYFGKSIPVGKNKQIKPCGIFKFDKDNFIIESSQYQNNDYGIGEKYTTIYEYDSLNLIIKKKMKYDLSKVTDTLYNFSTAFENITTYFYTDKKIDSTLTIFKYLDTTKIKKVYTSKSFYDNRELIIKNITTDSIVTFYAHQK